MMTLCSNSWWLNNESRNVRAAPLYHRETLSVPIYFSWPLALAAGSSDGTNGVAGPILSQRRESRAGAGEM